MRAAKLQKRVAKVGFDWPDESGALAKVHEELAELEEAMASQQKERMTDELGDLLFSCVNLARHLEIEPEMALRGTMRKFEKRFRYLEAELVEARQDISAQSIEQLEAAWQRAKLRA
jgi:ATP diphosphatase